MKKSRMLGTGRANGGGSAGGWYPPLLLSRIDASKKRRQTASLFVLYFTQRFFPTKPMVSVPGPECVPMTGPMCEMQMPLTGVSSRT